MNVLSKHLRVVLACSPQPGPADMRVILALEAGGLSMKRIRHSPEQIIRKLREADAELAKGTAIPEVCKALGVAENTYYRWRNQFGGMKADEMKRLKDLEKENARLKALVADLALDKAILQEAGRGNS